MPFYNQTLDDIPKEFRMHQKESAHKTQPEPGASPKTEDLLFILAVLLFLQDEPYFSALD